MSRDELLIWIRNSLVSFGDDVYLLEHDVGERCITAKLACYLCKHLPGANADLPTEQRWHVDCEYNRLGDNPKWFPWKQPIFGETSHNIYYTPTPDIICHRRGPEGPHLLVIEGKKENNVNDFLALIDRLKLIGCLGPPLNYAYGLYLSLTHVRGKPAIATAELMEQVLVRKAMNDAQRYEVWHTATQLVESHFKVNGRVLLCREPHAEMKARASEICSQLAGAFSFADVRDRLTLA